MILRLLFLLFIGYFRTVQLETSDRVLTQMVYKFLFSNEKICGDPFESSEWLPAVNECDIGCDETRYICVMHTDTKEQICRPLPAECEAALRLHLGWSRRTEPATTTSTTEIPTTKKTTTPTTTIPISTTFPPPVMLSYRPPMQNLLAIHSVDQNALSQTEQFQRDLLGFETNNNVNQQNSELIEIGSFRIASETEENSGYSFGNVDSNDIQEPAVIIEPTTTQRTINIETYPISRPASSPSLPQSTYNRDQYSNMNGLPPASEPRPPAINVQPVQEYVTASNRQDYMNSENYATPPPIYDGPVPPTIQAPPLEKSSFMLGQRVDLVPPPPPVNPVDMDPDDEYMLTNQIKHFDDPPQLKRMLSQGMNGGAVDLSRRCCEWALQGLCDRSWQKVRRHCKKSCGTLVCEEVEGVKSCNRVLNVDIEDCFETMRLVRYFGLRTASNKREKEALIDGVHHKLSTRKRKSKKKRVARA